MASAYVQVVSTNTVDSAPAVVFSTETERFMFDCGGGTQRLCTEHKVRLQKIEGVFFTETRTETIFGLPGLYLTLADGGKRSVSIYGPGGLHHFWAATSRFMYRPDMRVSIQEIVKHESFTQKECSIHCIPLPNSPDSPKNCKVNYICETNPKQGKFDVNKAIEFGVPKGPFFAKLKNGENVYLEDGRMVCSVDVVAPTEPGRCVAIISAMDETYVGRHIEMNDWKRFSMMDGGSSEGLMDVIVHLSDANVVFANPLYEKWIEGFGPSTRHIFAGRGACADLTAFQASTIQTRKYQAILPRLFPMMSLSSKQPYAEAALRPDISEFENMNKTRRPGVPSMKYNLLPSSQHGWALMQQYFSTEADVTSFVEDFFSSDGSCRSETTADLVNEMTLVTTCCDYVLLDDVTIDSAEKSIVNRYGLRSEAANALRNNSSNVLWFLGTGCAIPSKYRNVTSIFFKMKTGSILFDAGEGTWYQLLRMALAQAKEDEAPAEAFVAEILTGLSVIWISHPHADHHLGLVQVLAERKKFLTMHGDADAGPLLLIAPYSVLSFIDDYCKIDRFIEDAYVSLPNSFLDPNDDNFIGTRRFSNATNERSQCKSAFTAVSNCLDNIAIEAENRKYSVQEGTFVSSIDLMHKIWDVLDISDLQNVRVDHCSQSYGIRVWSNEGWSLVFSGDTRPCRALIELGKGATILIHEATFDDTKPEEAVQKKHSTVNEAYRVHTEMGTFRLLLTHFSQRYPTIPPHYRFVPPDFDASVRPDSVKNDRGEILNEICPLDAIFACDFLRMSFSDLLWAPSATAVMAAAFPVFEEEDGDEFLVQADAASGSHCSCSFNGSARSSANKYTTAGDSCQYLSSEKCNPASNPSFAKTYCLEVSQEDSGANKIAKKNKKRKLN